MAKITVKVRDGVVTIPTIAKVVKDGKIIRLIKVQENTEYKGYYHLTYVYPSSCGKGECSSEAWSVEELKNAKPCSVECWNTTIFQMAFAEMQKISQYVLGATINE